MVIIDFCISNGHSLDIIRTHNDFGINEWYLNFFNNESIRFIDAISQNQNKKLVNPEGLEYETIFLTTDDDLNDFILSINHIDDFGYNNVIVIDHSFQLRNPKVSKHICTRYYSKEIVPMLIHVLCYI